MSNGLDFPCPYCPCIFCSESDLNLHLEAFGRNSVLHGRKFRRVHFDVELTLSHKHGGVDRVVRDFENIILRYVRKRKKSVEKSDQRVGDLDKYC